jgi:ABC-type branched-subunit amino acid transport system substrate-binding protein
MKRAIALLAVAGVLAVGCKSSGEPATSSPSDTDSSGGTVATAPLSTEPGQGVTDSEIRIGVTFTDLSSIRDIVNIDHGDYSSAFQALADDINDAGGINGRKLVLVDGPVSPVGTDSATTTCTQLTEDEQVFAVIGNVQADVTSCYVAEHDTALVGGQQTPEGLAAAQAPWFAFDAGLDYVAAKTIQGAADEGAFDGKKVAVISLPVHEPLLADTIDPALEAAGADVVGNAVLDAPPDDQAAALAQAQTFAARFEADGADVVVAVGDAFLTLTKALEQSSYRPAIVATDSNVVRASLVGRSDYSVFEGIVTGGPPGTAAGWTEAPMQECVDRILAVQPDRQINDPTTATKETPSTWVSVTVACQAMTLLQAILEKAGPTLNNDTFRAAGETLGKIDIPGKGGPSDFTPTSPSGNPPVFLAHWDPATQELVTSSTPVA